MTNVYDKEYERTLKRSIKRKYGHCMKKPECKNSGFIMFHVKH